MFIFFKTIFEVILILFSEILISRHMSTWQVFLVLFFLLTKILCSQPDFHEGILSKTKPVESQSKSVILNITRSSILLHSCISFHLENTTEFSKSSRIDICCFCLSFFVVVCLVGLVCCFIFLIGGTYWQTSGCSLSISLVHYLYPRNDHRIIEQFRLEGTMAAIWFKTLAIKTRLLWGQHPFKVLNMCEDGNSVSLISKHLPMFKHCSSEQ